MGDLTLAQMETEIQFRLGARADLQAAGNIATWLKLSYLDIGSWFRHVELEKRVDFNTVNGTRIYTFTALSPTAVTDCRAIISIHNNTYPRRINRADAVRLDGYAESTGSAVVRYARYANGIEVDPTPNNIQSIRLRYRRRIPTPSVLTGVSELASEFDNFIICRAVWMGRSALGETDKAVTAKAEYMDLVRNYDWPVSEEEERDDDYPLGPPSNLR